MTNSEKSEQESFGACDVPVREFSLETFKSLQEKCKWPSRNIFWSLENLPSTLEEGDCRAELSKAFNLWESAGSLNISERPAGSGMIKVCFGDPSEYPVLIKSNGKAAPAFTYYPCEPSESNRGRIIFNSEKDWDLKNRSSSGKRSRFLCYATHEVGHSLGIELHGNPVPDAMAGNPIGWEGPLSDFDVSAIVSLYSNNANWGPGDV